MQRGREIYIFETYLFSGQFGIVGSWGRLEMEKGGEDDPELGSWHSGWAS